ncbi:MAG: putative zinc-binding metallopeptidase [Solirubrobacteraceae bacterium]|nr:putative zinc-binding metallopeptidase [Patulibacter sp.]
MRAFRCDHCGQLVFFENSLCLRCESALGFVPSTQEIHALVGEREGLRRCANLQLAECNWVVEDEGEELCRSCRITAVRPADDDPEGLENYASAEAAKRRIIYQLMDLNLPFDGDDQTLVFELKSSTKAPVTTGHADGVITLDLAESDDAQRVARREQLGEAYRTMLGHYRHELGHYYQSILLPTEDEWDRERALFGDERESYQEAMDRHYASGPPADWEDHFVSAYATMHPWEDWAETFAHYLHIRDTLQTAADFGMSVDGPQAAADDRDFKAAPQPEAGERGFREVLDNWLPLTYALNQVNRSMGLDDLYPFALADEVIAKLAYMHSRIHALETGAEAPGPAPVPAGVVEEAPAEDVSPAG